MSNPGVPGRPRPGATDRAAPASPQAPTRPGPAVAAGQPPRPYPAVSDNGQRANGSGPDSPTETLSRVTASAPPAAAPAGAPPAGATRASGASGPPAGSADPAADRTAEWSRPAYGPSAPAPVSTYASASAAAAASSAYEAPTTEAPEAGVRTTRRARLKITRVDPWSVMKLAFLLSIAVGIVLVVAVFVIWSVLDSVGVFSSIQNTVSDVTGEEGTFDIVGFVALNRVIGFTTLLSIANVVLLTALATLGAFLYNLAATFAGGLEVTLSDGD